MKKTLLITNLLLAVTVANADDYLVIMGAGGEGTKEDTIFDSGIRNMAGYVKNRGDLKVDIALNGGHSKTEELIRTEFPAGTPTSHFRDTDYRRLIAKYKEMLSSDKMKAGDQLMIYIDTHGAEKEAGFKTHRIATAGGGAATNLNTLQGTTLVALDELEVIKDLAAKKGVRLAIIDQSCHSGNTLKLADENTCVVSSTGPNHYGYTSFGYYFPSNMAKGKTLEQAFLETRSMETAPSYPMISSIEGMSVYNELYEKLTPFLYDYNEENDKLTPYLLKNNSEAQMCLSDANYKSLMATINSIEEMNTVSQKILWWTHSYKEIDFTELKQLLTDYKKTLDQTALKMRELNADRLNKEETITVRASAGNYRTEYQWKVKVKDLLTTDYDKLITETQARIQAETSNYEKTTLMGTMDFYQKSRARRDELLRNQPDLATIQSKQKEIMQGLTNTGTISSSIAREERKLFAAMYKQAQKANPDKSKNPCHNFRL